MKHIKQLFILTVAIIGLGSSAMAQGTLTWNWTWSGTYSGSGTLITADAISSYGSDTGYLITGITGTFNGQTITSLDAVESFRDDGDNLVSDSSPQLDTEGIVFSTTAETFNIFCHGSLYYIQSLANDDLYDYEISPFDYDTGTFTATLTAVPEPSTLALAVLGGLSGFGFLRRRK